MKLIINIPCYNEEETLPIVLKELPKKIEGIDKIEVQIVDDGSVDKTAEIAKKHGCRVIRHKKNLGLGTAFKHGMEVALDNGADVIVNTDADNQYPGRFIPGLVKPIVERKADIVIGDRRPWKVKHFSALKRLLQYVGNGVMRFLMGSDVPDTVSGFRAYSRTSLYRINVITKFSYVLDTIMQAQKKGLKILNYRIETNEVKRQSRLFKNIWEHIKKTTGNMMRLFYLYEPFKTFTMLSLVFFIPGWILILRFFYRHFFVSGSSNIQSLIFAAILIITSVLLFGFGIIGDSIKTNRMLIEEQLYYKKKELYNGKDEDGFY